MFKTVSHSVSKHRAPRRTVTSASPVRLADYGVSRALLELSGGAVIAAPPTGPVFGNHRPRRLEIERDTFVYALPNRTRAAVGVLTAGWVVSVSVFWWWWLAPEHRLGWIGLIVNSTLLAYLCLLPAYFLIAANRLRTAIRL